MKRKIEKDFILSVRLPMDHVKQLKKWADAQEVPPTIPEIVRVAVLRWMEQRMTFEKALQSRLGMEGDEK
jgi:hypothetical protein